MKISLTIVITLIFSGFIKCQDLTVNNLELDSLDTLKSNSDHKKFLEGVFLSDQLVREKEIQMSINCGYKSIEHKEAIQEMLKMDSINLLQIKQYLIKFEYPHKENVGEIASITPWLIIHHCGYPEVQLEYFSTIYTAWKMDCIDDDRFELFLSRLLSSIDIPVENLTLSQLISTSQKMLKYDFDYNK